MRASDTMPLMALVGETVLLTCQAYENPEPDRIQVHVLGRLEFEPAEADETDTWFVRVSDPRHKSIGLSGHHDFGVGFCAANVLAIERQASGRAVVILR